MNELLEPQPLLNAYAHGIFPMDVDGEVQWFSPVRRAVLPFEKFHVSKSLAQLVRQGRFETCVNKAFEQVMRLCGEREDGTWISDEIVAAYVQLHELGFAHSVESWRDGELVGGLYGVAIGGAFFGESMFHRQRDASKVGLVKLVERMRERGMPLLDVQYPTDHLRRFGVIEIPRQKYLVKLREAIVMPCTFFP